MFSFDNQVVFVTGSSTGIGKALALGFADHGAHVIVHGNANFNELDKTYQAVLQKGVQTLKVQGDLTNRDEVERIVHDIEKKFDHVDILINNAGSMIRRSAIEDLSVEDWYQIIDVNLTSIFHVTQLMIPLLRKQGRGNIINLTSVAAKNGGGKGAVAYAASKGGVSTFTKGLAKELAGDQIRVNAIAPGIISTPFHDRHSTDEMRKAMAKQVPLQREGRPDEVVGAALYLASEYGSYVTGEIIEVTGGMI